MRIKYALNIYLPAERCVGSLSVHSLCVSIVHFSNLKWETPAFIASVLWPQHPEMNTVYYKICSEMQQQVYLRKFHNVLVCVATYVRCGGKHDKFLAGLRERRPLTRSDMVNLQITPYLPLPVSIPQTAPPGIFT